MIPVDSRELPSLVPGVCEDSHGISWPSRGLPWERLGIPTLYAARHRGIYPYYDAPWVPVEYPTGPYGKPEGIPWFPMEDVHHNAPDGCHHVSSVKRM